MVRVLIAAEWVHATTVASHLLHCVELVHLGHSRSELIGICGSRLRVSAHVGKHFVQAPDKIVRVCLLDSWLLRLLILHHLLLNLLLHGHSHLLCHHIGLTTRLLLIVHHHLLLDTLLHGRLHLLLHHVGLRLATHCIHWLLHHHRWIHSLLLGNGLLLDWVRSHQVKQINICGRLGLSSGRRNVARRSTGLLLSSLITGPRSIYMSGLEASILD